MSTAAFIQSILPVLAARALTGGVVSPAQGQVGITFNGLTGHLSTDVNAATTDRAPEWAGQNINAFNPGLNYRIRLDVLSGVAPNEPGSSAVGANLTLNFTGRNWGLVRNTPGTSTGVWRVTLTDLSGGYFVEADFTMTVTNT